MKHGRLGVVLISTLAFGCSGGSRSRSPGTLDADAGSGGANQSGSGGRASGGSAGAGTGGTSSGGGGAASGGSGGASSGGTASGGTAGARDAGTKDAGNPLADASLDGSPRTDAATARDAAVCCADVAVWNASDGLLPNVDCPPWTLTNNLGTGPTLATGGMTISTSSNGNNQYFIHTASDLYFGDTVRIHFRMKLVSSSSSTTSRSAAGITFAFGPNKLKNFVFIDSGLIFINSAENTRGVSAAVATTDAMHDYVVDVDIANATVKVSYDGTPTLSGALFTTSTDYILWGEGSIYAYGTSVWETVEHDAWYPCPPPA